MSGTATTSREALLAAGDFAPRSRPPAAEPAETEDPRNALLTAFDDFAAALIANGLEVQLAERCRRFVPERPAPAAAAVRDAKALGLDDLDLAVILEVTKRLGKFRLAAAEHKSIEKLQGVVLALLPAPTSPSAADPLLAAGSPEASRKEPAR